MKHGCEVPRDVLTFAHISGLMSLCMPRVDVERRHLTLWQLPKIDTLYVVIERLHARASTSQHCLPCRK